MGFSSNWMKIISQLEETECCLSYDQRGHGRSKKPTEGYSPQDYAADLNIITDSLGWSKFNLVGHSMGGRNALMFASLYPHKVDHLVIEDIGPDSVETAHIYYENLLNLVPTPFDSRESARNFFENVFPVKAQTRENPKVLAQFFYANLTETPLGKLDWRFSKSAIIESVKRGRAEDYWTILKKLSVPTLILRGENSLDLSHSCFKEMISCNSKIQGVEIPNAGHWIHIDQPQLFTDVLKDFAGLDTKGP